MPISVLKGIIEAGKDLRWSLVQPPAQSRVRSRVRPGYSQAVQDFLLNPSGFSDTILICLGNIHKYFLCSLSLLSAHILPYCIRALAIPARSVSSYRLRRSNNLD